MNNRNFRLIRLAMLLILSLASNILRSQTTTNVQDDEPMEVTHKDYIPDTLTAIKVAEAVWLPIYGKKIYDYKPFRAKLSKENIWIVEGTVFTNKGGAPTIKINKHDGKIIDVYHPK